jgi:sulfhydrogenase subunit beta (sulfur reductase)
MKDWPKFKIDSPVALLDQLVNDGWRVIGPRVRDGAIVYDQISSARDLPRGLVDDQAGGSYRLRPGRDWSWFDYVVGPQSWKKWLFPARQTLWHASRRDEGFEIEVPQPDWPKTAFFGVRPCELAAIEVQDKVFDNGEFADTAYRRRREATLIVTVQCARSAATCFCASMDTGPRARAGFDVALTELGEHQDAGFLAECASQEGEVLLARLTSRSPSPADLDRAEDVSRAAGESQTRRMPGDIARQLRDNPDHPRWDMVAERCLSCANCTLVCPTCFCSDVEDTSDLSGNHAERSRVWDSCFTADFTYVHGGSIRRSTKSRYRQWMNHKLSSWFDQFATSGCVGCGRCITWCPVGIDITEEASAIAMTSPAEEA